MAPLERSQFIVGVLQCSVPCLSRPPKSNAAAQRVEWRQITPSGLLQRYGKLLCG